VARTEQSIDGGRPVKQLDWSSRSPALQTMLLGGAFGLRTPDLSAAKEVMSPWGSGRLLKYIDPNGQTHDLRVGGCTTPVSVGNHPGLKLRCQ
jgi:hypothetical protein